MKNYKKLLLQALMICLVAIIYSCEKNNLEQESLDISGQNKNDKIEKYDQYTVRKPKKDGVYLVAKNEHTGSQLSYKLHNAHITSFQILQRDGNTIIFDKLVIPTAENLPPWRPDCPDGWDEKLICYVNKDGVAVSYTRCTPTSFTIGLEPEW
ncbi:hypothetical protein [Aquimarina latercula]|uniref:hypothetical protein n=1 Tax=Aquimarina latercula TaxID=987 RepID=UPI0003FC2FB8|nr:hypothetical protein [Aquimarina latercula]